LSNKNEIARFPKTFSELNTGTSACVGAAAGITPPVKAWHAYGDTLAVGVVRAGEAGECPRGVQSSGCLVASHNLPHFTLGKFDQVGKCLVHN